MSLRNHLRAKQNVCLASAECTQNIAVCLARGGSVGVHTEHPFIGQQRGQFFLYTLRTVTKAEQVRGVAVRASFGQGLSSTTEMAEQIVILNEENKILKKALELAVNYLQRELDGDYIKATEVQAIYEIGKNYFIEQAKGE